MADDPHAAPILAALRATRTSARDRQTAMERSIRYSRTHMPSRPILLVTHMLVLITPVGSTDEHTALRHTALCALLFAQRHMQYSAPQQTPCKVYTPRSPLHRPLLPPPPSSPTPPPCPQLCREEARRLRAAEGGAAGAEDGAAGEGGAALNRAGAAAGAAAGRSVIDLEALAFAQGGHFMSNKGCTLPPGSYRCGRGGPHMHTAF